MILESPWKGLRSLNSFRLEVGAFVGTETTWGMPVCWVCCTKTRELWNCNDSNCALCAHSQRLTRDRNGMEPEENLRERIRSNSGKWRRKRLSTSLNISQLGFRTWMFYHWLWMLLNSRINLKQVELNKALQKDADRFSLEQNWKPPRSVRGLEKGREIFWASRSHIPEKIEIYRENSREFQIQDDSKWVKMLQGAVWDARAAEQVERMRSPK